MTAAAPVRVRSGAVRTGSWSPPATRTSGATVYRVQGRTGYFVKVTEPRQADDPRFQPAAEADRLRWLAGQGLPVPEVVEVGADDRHQWLVTTALPGRPAAGAWLAAERSRVVDLIADLARRLHALPVADCPFDRGLATLLGQARAAVRIGAVDLDDVDSDHAGWTAEQLLADLERRPPPAEDDPVVCHGDLCLDNVLIDPSARRVSGLLDAGRTGVADRWVDLSVVLNDIGTDEKWGYGPAYADRFLRRYGLAAVDRDRLEYYQLVDEFM